MPPPPPETLWSNDSEICTVEIRDGRYEVRLRRDGRVTCHSCVRTADAARAVAHKMPDRQSPVVMASRIVRLRCPTCHQVSGAGLPIPLNPSSDYDECDAYRHAWTVPKQAAPKP